MNALEQEINELHRNNVRLRIIGDRKKFSKKLISTIEESERITQNNTGLTLVIAVSYSGRWDIVEAAKNIASDVLEGNIKLDEVSEEIWLPGVHSDVGGGYAEDQLARHSLGLMIKRLKACLDNLGGQPILFNNQQLEVFTTVKEDTVFHFHGLGWGKSIRKIFVQVDDKPSPEQPWVHSSVGAIQQSPNAYSLVTKKPLFSSPKTIKNKIRYNPINLKMLNKNYIEVD